MWIPKWVIVVFFIGFVVDFALSIRSSRKKIDWTEWKGGTCPIPSGTVVLVKLFGGTIRVGLAEEANWGRTEGFVSSEDIIAYCVVED